MARTDQMIEAMKAKNILTNLGWVVVMEHYSDDDVKIDIIKLTPNVKFDTGEAA